MFSPAREHRDVPEGLRSLRSQEPGSFPGQRPLREQEPLHGGWLSNVFLHAVIVISHIAYFFGPVQKP